MTDALAPRLDRRICPDCRGDGWDEDDDGRRMGCSLCAGEGEIDDEPITEADLWPEENDR